MKKITTPLTAKIIRELSAGEQVLLSGDIFTARDAAHKRMTELLDNGEPLPFYTRGSDNKDATVAVYYAGPCPAPYGRVIGSIGPTTSSRMDAYAPRLMKEGVRVMIGKGSRGSGVIDAIKEYNGIYFAAVGGAGAYYSRCVIKNEIIAFEDLGPEAIYKLTVSDMPLVIAIDSSGKSIYT